MRVWARTMARMARSEVRQTIKRIRRQLSSAQRSEFAVLDGAIDDATTTITLADDPSPAIRAGSLLNLDLEVMRLRADPAGKICEVRRGWQDSEAVTHADGDEIAVNPRFSMLDIYEAMVDEITSWPAGIYRVESQTFAFATDAQTIELPAAWADMYRVLGVAAHRDDSWLGQVTAATKWPGVGGWSLLTTPVGTIDQALTSGRLLRILDPALVGTVVVTIAGPLLAFAMEMSADLIEDVGIPASALDIVDAGVKLRLSIDGEYGRTGRTVQGDSRDASETPIASMVPWMQLLQATYRRRLSDEVWKLHEQWPPRMS